MEKPPLKHPIVLKEQELVNQLQKGLASFIFGDTILPKLKIGYGMSGGKISSIFLEDENGDHIGELLLFNSHINNTILISWLEEIIRRCNHKFFETEKKKPCLLCKGCKMVDGNKIGMSGPQGWYTCPNCAKRTKG